MSRAASVLVWSPAWPGSSVPVRRGVQLDGLICHSDAGG